jgi:hypothetical protein
VLQALGTIWFRFLQKKSKKKFHACVPLKGQSNELLFFYDNIEFEISEIDVDVW